LCRAIGWDDHRVHDRETLSVRITNEVLEYVKDLDFSVREISDAFELKYQTVFYWRKKFLNLKQSEELSIVPRSKLGRPSLKSILNREELYDLYVVKKMSPREICKNYGCGYRVILKYLHYFGVPVRTRIEGLQNSKGKKKVFKRARKFQKLSEIISKEEEPEEKLPEKEIELKLPRKSFWKKWFRESFTWICFTRK
jgi:transposase